MTFGIAAFVVVSHAAVWIAVFVAVAAAVDAVFLVAVVLVATAAVVGSQFH